MKSKALVISLFFWSNFLCAIESQPYPKAEISTIQWQSYYDLVLATLAKSERRYEVQKLVTYSDEKTKTSYAFTLPGHPAHPSWITRITHIVDGELRLDQIGYFAGEEKEFAKLFNAYEKMNEETRKQYRK